MTSFDVGESAPPLTAGQKRPFLLAASVFAAVVAAGTLFVGVARDRDRIRERGSVGEQTLSALSSVEREARGVIDFAQWLANGSRGRREDAARYLELTTDRERTFDGVLLLRGDAVVSSLGSPWPGDPGSNTDMPNEPFPACGGDRGDSSKTKFGGPPTLTSARRGSRRILAACMSVPVEPGQSSERVVVWTSWDRLFHTSGLSRLSHLDYELLIGDAEGGNRREILARSVETPLDAVVEREVVLAGSALVLRVAPQTGWSREESMVSATLVALLVGLGAAVLTYDLARRPEALRRELAEAVQKLLDTEKALTLEFQHRRDAEDELERERVEDRLTGLPSRDTLIVRLQILLDGMRGGASSQGALVLLGTDRLSAINESLGHAVADELLRALARRIGPAIDAGSDPGRTLGRLGGNEFSVLLQSVSGPGDAKRLADRLRQSFETPFRLLDQDVFLNCRIGIAMVTMAYRRADQVLRDANVALQRAKASASAEPVFFDEEMHRRALNLLELESDLRRALDTNALSRAYQPIVSLAEGTIAGFEALARWQHPQRGAVPPFTFVSIAEDTGLVGVLDRANLRNGAIQLKQWHEAFPRQPSLKLSTNLSGKTLLEPGLVDFVKGVILASGVAAGSLHLEVTETVVMANADAAERVLKTLHEAGVRLYLDDFGTGYSSLGYLRRFPFHTVKIDRSFVSSMTEDPKAAEMVRVIVNMARSLEMTIVAEGIETEQQLSQLRELECEFGQGYLFSKPLPADEMEALLRKRPRF